MTHTQERLFIFKDDEYAIFTRKLTPNVPAERILGVRMPALKAFARELQGSPEAQAFLKTLPHEYYDEDNLHACLINNMRDFDRAFFEIDAFLPHVNNWATCDALNPACIRQNRDEALVRIYALIRSNHAYTVRFGVCALMRNYLNEGFDPAHLTLLADIQSNEYYVNMAIAWYFATAIAVQPNETLAYLMSPRLPDWTRRKAIQKCKESYRVPPQTKALLAAAQSKPKT